ncbi:hypothetical protein PAMP_007391 [Pampus punctatissimus]
MSSATDQRNVRAGYSRGGGTVKGFVQKVHSPDRSLNDSLAGEIQTFLTDEDQLHTYDDLTKVNPVTPTTVIKCLQARYRVKVFYTHAGCTLVALNPFQPIPDLYSLDVMKEYHCAPQPQEAKPHIFIVAEEAYRNVQGQVEPVNQSLVVSGESGAGKTWTSRCLMKYYATVAASSSVVKSQNTVERIERRVLDSNPIMEAFEDCFHETIEAMVHLGVNAERRRQIFRILAGILQLGNVNFCSSADESQPCNLEEQSKDSMQRAAELLRVPAEELQTCLREEYVSEGLEWSFVKYQDNQSCLDLIEGSPISVFSLLNEESRLNRASDAKKFRIRLEKELCDKANISWDKFSKEPHFSVAHYAGKVNYQIQGMVEKNKDPVPPELIDLLQKADNPLLQQIFADKETESSATKGLSKVTVVSKFKNSLENLMRILHTTTPHYTRCIKPNPECKPLTFKKEEVIMQLEACGIVETIHISAAGFPIRIPFKSFLQRYELILKYSRFNSRTPTVDVETDSVDILPQEVEKLLRVVLQHQTLDLDSEKSNSLVHCGRTKVFLTQFMLDLLEDQRKTILSRCAFSIQCCWLRYQRRRRHIRHRSATLIQAAVRSWRVRRQIQRWNRAAAVIQSTWRKRRALLKSLAEAELDDAKDFMEEDVPVLNPVIRERGSVQLSTIQEPVTVRGWPMGLALASAPSITVSLTATGFQKMMSVMASLNLPSRRGEYKVETNQYTQGLASIRAQPRGSVKLHYQRSPLLYADRHPEQKTDVTGFNEILLEKTL